MLCDIFISCSRKHNRNHRITEVKDRIAFSGEEHRCFNDTNNILA